MNTQNNDGKGRFGARNPLLVGGFALLILVGGFGTWSVLTEIAGAIVASGRVEVDRNRQVVQHLDGGIVSEIHVEEGDVVDEGALLLRLDDTFLISTLAITESQLFELMARRGRLEAERDNSSDLVFEPELLERATGDAGILDLLDGQKRLFEARRVTLEQEVEQLGKRRGQISNQVEGIDAQTIALSTQLDLIRDELEDQQQLLDKGLAQATRVLALRREEAGLAGRVGELTAQRAQAEGRITEIDIEILKLATAWREQAITQLRDLRYREVELSEQRRQIEERLSRLDIRAPVSGVVYGMQVFALRSVVRPAATVLFVIPQDRPLVIAAQVPVIHVDQVFPGQTVSLRFSAFDQRTTPELFGEVTQISADAFQDEVTAQSYYRAEIVLSEGEAAKLPANLSLIPGMPVDAYLRTEDRTPLAYLVKPLADYFTKAFRES
ncbi:HlyD family type I secretion periplasmic adaptor subunit [Shimia abyssi]|uniref:Membrane fusion protein (MFP) family protein n=1 Tax=Shimia abyssi TaxID=1662395 RepID=A0A2P8FHS7_9RHOB|nr:HlyD family type I secretion periplasmic adaptor subunit [Shimia abyssi]PSL21258.1 HlyD family secretion protein [Shimia abyssi]